MKKLSYVLLAIAAAGILACSQNQVKYDVTGKNAPEDGATVFLIDQISSAHIDSTVVANGAFRMTGKAEKDAFLAVNIDGDGWWFLLFNDGKPVQIDVAEKTVSGSDLNNRLTECDLKNSEAYEEYSDFIREFLSLPEEEQIAKQAEFIPQYQAKLKEYSDCLMSLIEENRDNLVPVAFINHVPSLFGDEKFNELVSSDAPFAKHPFTQDLKRKFEESNAEFDENQKRKQDIVGQHFLDLEEPGTDGKMHKLSEYAGKGRWVLVDFWAAWCGPCKAEMPHVVAAYKKYHDKGFDVVGLSFDRDKEDWLKAIKEWDMPWIHLSDLKYWQSVPQEVYNVDSIPDNLLIDPEGTIVARGLRGEDLEARLAGIFK
jgi:thiol-disulfide isomerase/thioredoxin